MNTGIKEAVLLTVVMAAVIFLCRSCAFLFFRKKKAADEGSRSAFLNFVEKTVPPLAMTVLTFNALTNSIHEDLSKGIPVLIAAAITALVHLWRRNPLLSIFGGTAVYMILERTAERIEHFLRNFI